MGEARVYACIHARVLTILILNSHVIQNRVQTVVVQIVDIDAVSLNWDSAIFAQIRQIKFKGNRITDFRHHFMQKLVVVFGGQHERSLSTHVNDRLPDVETCVPAKNQTVKFAHCSNEHCAPSYST